MKRTALRIEAFRVANGQLPYVDVPEGWTLPVYCIREDGDEVRLLNTDVARRTRLPSFGMIGSTREEAVGKVLNVARALCEYAGFAGTAGIMVNFDCHVEPGWFHEVQAAVVFSGWDRGEDENLAGFPKSLEMEDEEYLLASLDAHIVLGS